MYIPLAPGSLYLGQVLRFRKKVYVGDAVVARLIVRRVQGRRTTFETTCVKEDSGEVAVEGEAGGLLRQP